jgi:hypothetical protein
MLKGEVAEPYLAPSRDRRLVCQLCAPRAQREGWIRESAKPDTPARPQRLTDRRRLPRLRRRAAQAPTEESAMTVGKEDVVQGAGSEAERGQQGPDLDERRLEKRERTATRERHVRAVPTNAELKIGRALDLFNQTEHTRTVAGISRTLGAPRVSATTSPASAAEVLLTVAWEISWYQFAVDLSDASQPVQLRGRGHELDELPEDTRRWNAQARPDGTLSVRAGEG